MAWHAHRIPRHLTFVSILIALVLLAGPFVAGGESEPAGSQERLRELLTERYDVLKEMYASRLLQLKHGQLDPVEWRRATFELHHAEAELCTTDAARIEVYEKLVEAMRTQEELAAQGVDAGRIPKGELAEARVATLQARIDLERARLGRQTSR